MTRMRLTPIAIAIAALTLTAGVVPDEASPKTSGCPPNACSASGRSSSGTWMPKISPGAVSVVSRRGKVAYISKRRG